MPPGTLKNPTLSLLDRLSVKDRETYDDALLAAEKKNPDSDAGRKRRQADKFYHQDVVQRYKASVKRDLEWLLNTRTVFDKEKRVEKYAELSTSVYAYGLEDITSVNVGSVLDQRRLVEMMERSVRLFEPRLRDIHIEFDTVAGGSRSLKFKITGVLMIYPEPENIWFDTVLDSNNGKYEVK